VHNRRATTDHTEPVSAKESKDSKGLGARLDRIAGRVPGLRPVLTVKRRYDSLHGDQLAAAITLLAFLSIFPLLLVAIAVVGFFSAHSATLATSVIHRLGLTGTAATTLTGAISSAEHSRRAASVIGLLGLAWAGLGLVGALQYGYDQVWEVPSRGLRDRLFGVVWLLGAALILAASAFMTAVVNWLPALFAPLGLALGLAVDVALWLWTAHTLTNRDVGWRPLLPGAIVGAVGLEVLKAAGSFYVPRAVASSSALYGSLGIVFAVLAWLLLFGKLVIYSAVVNVVRYEQREHATIARTAPIRRGANRAPGAPVPTT